MQNNPVTEQWAQIAAALHAKWTPTQKQAEIGKALIFKGFKDIFVQAGRNFGKALDLETEIPTPDGWKELEDIHPGDLVFGDDGKPTRVIGESPIYTDHACFEIEFDDGSKIIADADHNWLTKTKSERRRGKPGSKRTTAEISKSLFHLGEANHSIDNCQPIQWEEAALPIPPYTLGAWLGNGMTNQASISQWDMQVLDEITFDGFEIRKQWQEGQYGILGLRQLLREAGLLGSKKIPLPYLTASASQRLALVQGLMDTDGTVTPWGACCFDNTNEQIALSFLELLHTLGVKSVISSRIGKLNGVEHKVCYRVTFSPPIQVFRLKRKADRLGPHLDGVRRKKRSIVAVVPIPSRPVKCISVDNPSHLFLVGRQCIPTHNTELVVYLLWRYAQSYPNSENYYFSPFQRQSREILWASRRLQTFGPAEWIEGKPNDTEMRIRFRNGSFIKLDGSDNVESYRGVKPKGLSIFDEFKDFRPEFYDAYDPNRAAHDAPLLIIGTPPDRECQFLTVAEQYRVDPNKRFFKAPTHDNQHVSKTWLEKKKTELLARGEEDVWQREYLAEYVPGGVSKIFPMLTRGIVKPHAEVIGTIRKDLRKLEWYLIADPAAASVFGGLYLALNPYTRMIYALDELYETEQAAMTVRMIGTRMIKSMNEFYVSEEWTKVYDEAEAWFQAEMLENFNEGFIPTQKARADKSSGLTLIKDVLLQGKLVISDRCKKFFWELDNYYKDRNGKIPKANDHLIDCFRYGLDAMHYSFSEEQEVQKDELEKLRGRTIEADFKEMFAHEIIDLGDDYV